MDRDELIAFLGAHDEAVVSAIGEDGFPTACVARYELDGDVLTLHLDADDPVSRLAAAGAPICAVVEHAPTYAEIQGATLHGTPHVTDDGLRLDLDDVASFDFRKIDG